MKLLGFDIATECPALETEKKVIVNTINPHSYCISKTDAVFDKALHEADVLLPDGIGVVWAARILKNKNIKKIAGYDAFLAIMAELNEVGGTCFFLGSSNEVLEKIKIRANKEYPKVKVNTHSPPYLSEFSDEENNVMLEKINRVGPNVLFVGMTAPKQEKWVHKNKGVIRANMVYSIGAVFDFYAGTVKRAGDVWIKLGLEWLPRFLKEPKRLATRNLVSTPKFILEVLSQKILGKSVL